MAAGLVASEGASIPSPPGTVIVVLPTTVTGLFDKFTSTVLPMRAWADDGLRVRTARSREDKRRRQQDGVQSARLPLSATTQIVSRTGRPDTAIYERKRETFLAQREPVVALDGSIGDSVSSSSLQL